MSPNGYFVNMSPDGDARPEVITARLAWRPDEGHEAFALDRAEFWWEVFEEE